MRLVAEVEVAIDTPRLHRLRLEVAELPVQVMAVRETVAVMEQPPMQIPEAVEAVAEVTVQPTLTRLTRASVALVVQVLFRFNTPQFLTPQLISHQFLVL